MPIITALSPAQGHEGRVLLTLDRTNTLAVSAAFIQQLGLRVGSTIGASETAAATRDAEYLRTFDRALTILESRAHAAHELRQKLLTKGEPEDYVETAIRRLGELGLLDDRGYAEDLIRQRMRRGVGRPVLREELARRGIPSGVADAALDAVLGGDADDDGHTADAALRAVAAKKLRTLQSQPPAVARRRLFSFLARKGHDEDTVRALVEELLGASDAYREDETDGHADADGDDPLE